MPGSVPVTWYQVGSSVLSVTCGTVSRPSDLVGRGGQDKQMSPPPVAKRTISSPCQESLVPANC